MLSCFIPLVVSDKENNVRNEVPRGKKTIFKEIYFKQKRKKNDSKN
jgi:hypothetical protein